MPWKAKSVRKSNLNSAIDCNRPLGQSEYFIFFDRLAASERVSLFQSMMSTALRASEARSVLPM